MVHRFNDWCGGVLGFQLVSGEVYSMNWTSATWAASTVTNNWYLSLPNHNLVTAVNCTASGEYTELSDGKRPNQCMTAYYNPPQPYQVYDLTCQPGKASQEWGVLPEGGVNYGTGTQYALYNEYFVQKVAGCSGHTQVIYAAADSGANAGLVMGCPDSAGKPTPKELWYVGE